MIFFFTQKSAIMATIRQWRPEDIAAKRPELLHILQNNVALLLHTQRAFDKVGINKTVSG